MFSVFESRQAAARSADPYGKLITIAAEYVCQFALLLPLTYSNLPLEAGDYCWSSSHQLHRRRSALQSRTARQVSAFLNVDLPRSIRPQCSGEECTTSADLLLAFQPDVVWQPSLRAVGGDWNCLYCAVSLALYGTQHYLSRAPVAPCCSLDV